MLAAAEPQLRGGNPCVRGPSGAVAEGIMTRVTYSDDQQALIATVEAPDAIKDQLFDAYLAKTPWLLNSRCYEIRGMLISPARAGSREIRVTLTFLHWDESGE
jgi:predicted transcriptional regulator